MKREQKITLGEMSASGVRGLLIYCSDNRCGHLRRLSATEVGTWSDSVTLSDLEPRFVCPRCGKRGADARPDFAPARMGSSGLPERL
jgi:hypothetical protein